MIHGSGYRKNDVLAGMTVAKRPGESAYDRAVDVFEAGQSQAYYVTTLGTVLRSQSAQSSKANL